MYNVKISNVKVDLVTHCFIKNNENIANKHQQIDKLSNSCLEETKYQNSLHEEKKSTKNENSEKMVLFSKIKIIIKVFEFLLFQSVLHTCDYFFSLIKDLVTLLKHETVMTNFLHH